MHGLFQIKGVSNLALPSNDGVSIRTLTLIDTHIYPFRSRLRCLASSLLEPTDFFNDKTILGYTLLQSFQNKTLVKRHPFQVENLLKEE